MRAWDYKGLNIGSNMFRGDTAIQGFEVGGSLWTSTLRVSSPLAVHQVFLGGPHDACRPIQGQIGRGSATNVCKCSVPIQAM